MITLGGDAELELVDSLDPFSEGIVFRLVSFHGNCVKRLENVVTKYVIQSITKDKRKVFLLKVFSRKLLFSLFLYYCRNYFIFCLRHQHQAVCHLGSLNSHQKGAKLQSRLSHTLQLNYIIWAPLYKKNAMSSRQNFLGGSQPRHKWILLMHIIKVVAMT